MPWGFDLLDTTKAIQLRQVDFLIFNISEAITLLNQAIQNEIKQYNQGTLSAIKEFHISETFSHNSIYTTLLIMECFADYYFVLVMGVVIVLGLY